MSVATPRFTAAFAMTTSKSLTMRTISMTLLPWVVTPVVLVALTLSGLAHANPQRAQLQANFQAADVDRNEQLNLAEFKTFINLNADHKLGRSASVRRFGMYTTAFKAIDANGDGVVTKEEIAAQAKQ
jgi:hypothetical protein